MLFGIAGALSGLATSDASTQTEKAEGYGLSEPSITSISSAETKREDPDGNM